MHSSAPDLAGCQLASASATARAILHDHGASFAPKPGIFILKTSVISLRSWKPSICRNDMFSSQQIA
eukprot:4320567-Pyramimonas_sp.AAC.1